MLARVAAAVLAATLLVPAAAQAGAEDLVETRREQLSPRLLELGFRTPALPEETNVRVLLPAGYDAEPARRYPVLYLLHGCCDFDVDGSQAWTTHGRVEELTQDLPLIVVMPAGGRGGMYSDWAADGGPQWQTYHLDQLVPWVDRELRTVAERRGRAIAGLSMGGYGATKYAVLHPDRFVFAASFSGAPDVSEEGSLVPIVLPGLDGGTPGSVWGLPGLSAQRWRAENPGEMAENLAPVRYELRTGDGRPGPLDEGGLPLDPIEALVHRSTIRMHERLVALGIGHVWDDYGAGTHRWPYWARSLERTLPALMATFADPPAPPSRVTYRNPAPAYEAFGWKVRFARDGLAFTRLVDAGPDGFRLEGAGTARVTTPAVYAPGATGTVTVDEARSRVRAGDDGRLTIALDASRAVARRVRIDVPLASRTCASRRVVSVRLPRVRGGRLTRVAVRTNSRRHLVRTKSRRHLVRVDLRGLSGTVRVEVRGTYRVRGKRRTVVVRRTYRLCAR